MLIARVASIRVVLAKSRLYARQDIRSSLLRSASLISISGSSSYLYKVAGYPGLSPSSTMVVAIMLSQSLTPKVFASIPLRCSSSPLLFVGVSRKESMTNEKLTLRSAK